MKRKITISAFALTALAACSSTPENDVFRSYYQDAGDIAGLNKSQSAVQRNVAVMTGQSSYVVDLSNRFSSEVNSTVNFAFNSAQLDAVAQQTLRQQAHWINQFPEVGFRVYGHTDAVGSNSANKQLGLRRAHAVVAYLASQGVSRSRLEATVSVGEEQPLIVTQGRERQNRRTVTEVSGFVQSNQTILDGRYAAVIAREYIQSGQAESTLSSQINNSGLSGGG